jgi:hypothetical protein
MDVIEPSPQLKYQNERNSSREFLKQIQKKQVNEPEGRLAEIVQQASSCIKVEVCDVVRLLGGSTI